LAQLNLTEAARQLVGGLCPADSNVPSAPVLQFWHETPIPLRPKLLALY
jgi:hypothetical protein